MPDLGNNQAPVQEQKASTELPEWAKPYAKDILAKGQALTDVNQNPYQQYTQPRIAGFSPMQQQAMQNAQGMSVSPQTGEATAGATMAGLGGLGVAGQANQYGFQNQMGGYMNPYMNQILAPQLAEANRQYDIGATKQQSAATQAGAFGGSREAIMAAENERNRNTGLNQIYGQGMNTAYNQAQNQYNQNLQNQLAGYGLMNQASSNLGQLGQNQYGQEMGINQLQNQYGAQQQAQMQKGLDTSYQDFLNQQNYPYKQLGFMSDMIRGLPLGQQSTTQMYQAPPTALQTAGALGLGAYGFNQLSKMAGGGEVKGYDGGGGIHDDSVTSQDNTLAIINEMTDPKALQVARQNAEARHDDIAVAAIDKRLLALSESASMSRGLAGVMPQQMVNGVAHAAGGGILAFGPGGETNDETETANPQQLLADAMYSRGDPVAYHGALKNLSGVSQRIREFNPESYTPEDQARMNEMFFNQERTQAGPSPYGSLQEDQKTREEDRKKAIEVGKGAIALRGMRAILKGNNLARGLGELGGETGEGAMQLMEADRREKRAIADMDFKIKNAERQERMGMTKSAQALTASAVTSKKAAEKARLDKLLAEGKIEQGIAIASKQTGKAGGAGGGEKEYQMAARVYKADLKRQFPNMSPEEIEAKAFQKYQNFKSSGTAGAEVKSFADANAAFKGVQYTRDWKKHVEENYGKGTQAQLQARKDWIEDFRSGRSPQFETAQAAPQQTRPTSSPNVIKLD